MSSRHRFPRSPVESTPIGTETAYVPTLLVASAMSSEEIIYSYSSYAHCPLWILRSRRIFCSSWILCSRWIRCSHLLPTFTLSNPSGLGGASDDLPSSSHRRVKAPAVVSIRHSLTVCFTVRYAPLSRQSPRQRCFSPVSATVDRPEAMYHYPNMSHPTNAPAHAYPSIQLDSL